MYSHFLFLPCICFSFFCRQSHYMFILNTDNHLMQAVFVAVCILKNTNQYSCIHVGETFILFNKQMKGNKRELIQLGVPIFGQIKEDAKCKTIKEFVITYNCFTLPQLFGSSNFRYCINESSDSLLILFFIFDFCLKAI